MQRWIVAVVAALMVLGAGGLIAYYKLVHKPNRPSPMWVALPIREDLDTSKRDALIKDMKEKLSDPELLGRVSKDLGLVSKWNLGSDAECAKELARRLFVKAGDTPDGKHPAIHIGVKGKLKELKLSGEIATRLMDDVWKILGVDPPPKKQP